MILGKEVTVVVSDWMEHMVQSRDDGSCMVKPANVGECAPFLRSLGYVKVEELGNNHTWRRVVAK